MENILIGTTQNVNLKTESAGLGKRTIAFIIDNLIIIGFFLILSFINGFTNIIGFQYLSIFFAIIYFFYNFIFEVIANGGSFGKTSQKIRVVKITGESASIIQYFIRALFRPVDMVMGVGLVLMMFNDRNQRLGDLVAGTFVVKISKDISIEDTILANLEENYEPFLTRSQIEKLTPQHIETIKKIYEEAIKTRKYEHFLKMHAKVLEITGVQHDLIPLDFIKRVIKDYTYYA